MDVIVVGAGSAGLTASIYLKRAGLDVLVLEGLTPGGKIINTPVIENYPALLNISGYDFTFNILEQIKKLDIEIKLEKVLNIKDLINKKQVITNKNTYEAKAVILATGSTNRKLNLENEDNLIGRGISYCATCDGNFYKEKIVALVGGGNTSFSDALYLSNIAKKVYIINRTDKLRAEEKLVEEVKQKQNIEIILNEEVTKIIGETKLEKVILKNRELLLDGLFIAIGQIPEKLDFDIKLDKDKFGYIKSDESCITNILGVFVAGDSRSKELRQLVTAVSDGANAADAAIKYINSLK